MKIISIHKNREVEALLPQLKNQDRLAQKELFDRYGRRMLGVCRTYISDRQHAEDCMLKGFLKVFSRVGSFQSVGSFEGWIRRIMVNECLDFIKLHKSMIYLEEEEFISHEEIEEESDFGEFDAQYMVDQLPENYRTVFNLFVIEEYTHKEIAQLLNISEGASKSQLLRAKNKLRNFILEQKQKANEN